jgi:hypothetical protein
MLFKILKLFGLDVPAKVAAAKVVSSSVSKK